MTCDAKIRPFPGNREIACEEQGEHDSHRGVARDMAYPGSETAITWLESDRRTYHGEWPGECCVCGPALPAGHGGKHL